MSQVDEESVPAPIIRTMQIIIFALTTGLVFFLGITLFLRAQPKPAPPQPAARPAQDLPILSYAAIAFAVMAVPMSLVIPSVVVKASRKQIAQGTWTESRQATGSIPPGPVGDTVRLALVYQTSLIIGGALNEGAAFFALIAYLIEGYPAILGVAALLILGLAARFPTRTRVEQWIDTQQELLSLEQKGGG